VGHPCGAVPVVDEQRKPVGFLIDRDVCLIATAGIAAAELAVVSARVEPLGAKLKFSRDEIHVWLASFELGSQQLAELERTLSADEIARASRFYFERDRRNYIGRRGILRAILATYLETEPSAVRFLYNEFGKPRLEGSQEARGLSFNLSHSGLLNLVAVGIDREVGVDIELINSSVSSDELARRFFSPNEVATLEALPQSLRLAGFFKCWARKEAFIKARGMGLSIPLDSFDVSPIQDETVALVRTANSAYLSNWKIEDLDIDPGCAAAVAADGRDWKVALKNWSFGASRPN
jgi:4'-phosphopantetheinyl transferase